MPSSLHLAGSSKIPGEGWYHAAHLLRLLKASELGSWQRACAQRQKVQVCNQIQARRTDEAAVVGPGAGWQVGSGARSRLGCFGGLNEIGSRGESTMIFARGARGGVAVHIPACPERVAAQFLEPGLHVVVFLLPIKHHMTTRSSVDGVEPNLCSSRGGDEGDAGGIVGTCHTCRLARLGRWTGTEVRAEAARARLVFPGRPLRAPTSSERSLKSGCP